MKRAARAWYSCDQQHRWRAVKLDWPRPCPQCGGIASPSAPLPRGGVVYPRWLKDRDEAARLEVERAAKLLLPGGENVRVEALGPDDYERPASFVQPDQPVQSGQPGHPDQIDPSGGDPAGKLRVMALSEAYLALLATPLSGEEQRHLNSWRDLNGDLEGNSYVRTLALRPPFVPPTADDAGVGDAPAGERSRWKPPVSELSADVPAEPPPPRLIYISELSPLPQAVIVAAREVVWARRASQGRHSWPLAVTMRSLEDAVAALDAAPPPPPPPVS